MANHDHPTFRDYWTEIQNQAQYFSDNDPDGEGWIAEGYDEDDLYGAMMEVLDSHQFVIYNAKALRVLEHSESDHAYHDEFGELPKGETVREIAPPMALYAMLEDIQNHSDFVGA